MMKTAITSIVLSMSLAGSALAQGNAEAGSQKAQSCAACHGEQGVSASGAFPSLAGQVPGYIATQLNMFKAGERESAQMSPMAMPLSDEDIADLDAYYSTLTAFSGSIPEGNEEIVEAGAHLYRGGFAELKIPACMSCHGPHGSGIPPKYPRIAGQQVDYLKAALTAYKDGSRKSEVMEPIAFLLSQEQIDNLAQYIHALK